MRRVVGVIRFLPTDRTEVLRRMPIINRQDASEVEAHIERVFGAGSPEERVREIRGLFVETLDFEPTSGEVGLAGGRKGVELPGSADRVAELEGVSVAYVHLDTRRVRRAEAAEAVRQVSEQLDGDLLMAFTNQNADQLHLIYPSFEGVRPTLRRMVIERDLPRRTAVTQVSNIYHEWQDTGSLHAALESAFDVEAVTREFFSEYKRVYDRALDGITGFGADEAEQEAKKVFTQTLFNRLMFVYFVSRKGWLSFDGDRDYLNALWGDYRAKADDQEAEPNFRYDRLRPLFFGRLNNPFSEDPSNYPGARRLTGDVPFLNGGLFEETDLDRRSDVTVSDGVIRSIFDDLFDRFNFTVMESTPFDVEVAVDPEMLGKVFEELVTGRHDSGAYYTPRPVVSFMCREALKGYLQSRVGSLSENVISEFVDERDTSGVSVSDAREIGRALDDVTVVDPACGSGAYLLGMMQELVELQTELYNAGLDSKSLYDLKLQIIERNLYGADLDQFAVNIAMLRLWLSLSIEYDDPGKPPALPNLDFKIVCGDSLLAPDPNPSLQANMFTEAIRNSNLGDLKAEYMRANRPDSKPKLRERIAAVEAELRDTLGEADAPEGSVDWRIQFAEVMGRGGFDVVVANPPYVQLQNDGGRLGRLYREVGFETLVRTGDIYQLFYERGCQLLKDPAGLLAYITSNSWLRAEYGKRTRRYFSEQHTPLRFLDLGKDVFDSAIVDSGVLLLRTGGESAPFPAVDMDRLPNADFPPDESLWGQIRSDGESPWSALSTLEQGVMDKMLANGTPLKDWDVKINRGVITGLNVAFIIDDVTKDKLIREDPKSSEIIKPILRGRDIGRYQAKWAGLWLIDTHNGYGGVPAIKIDAYSAIKAHLDGFFPRLEKRYDKGSTPYNLRNCAYHEDFTKEKLFWMDMTPTGRFTYSSNEAYCNDKGFMMTGTSLKYLCAVLNSSLVTWLMKSMALTTGMGLLQWKKFAVERIPVPEISVAIQGPFIQLVDEIIEAKSTDPDADTWYLEVQIDDLVYELYGLNEEERTAIDRSLGLIHQTDEEEDAATVKWIEAGRTGKYVSMEEVMATFRGDDDDTE